MRKGRKARTNEDIQADIEHQLRTSYKVNENGCWVWNGPKFDNGYGRIARHLKRAKLHIRAHIASYQLHKDDYDSEKFVCHSCDVKLCINPDHLWLGTNQENQIDAAKKGAFDAYWTNEKREEKSRKNSGSGNPMYGRKGEEAPAYGRTGEKHPMYGKCHTAEAKAKIAASLKKRK